MPGRKTMYKKELNVKGKLCIIEKEYPPQANRKEKGC